ncbi:hypothetical protein EDL99_10120 [Ornithobacterium rhinotracheale]|nr:hypothetical protein [Ornithobacterium rhinotracheale]
MKRGFSYWFLIILMWIFVIGLVYLICAFIQYIILAVVFYLIIKISSLFGCGCCNQTEDDDF